MFEWIDELMDATGCDYETALREYDATHNPDYNPNDYDAPNNTDYVPDDYYGY